MTITADDLYTHRFLDELQFPPVLRLSATTAPVLHLRARTQRLHPLMPPTPVWAYVHDGPDLVNPTLVAESRVPAQVTFVNELSGGPPLAVSRTEYTGAIGTPVVVANLPGAVQPEPGYHTDLGVAVPNPAWPGTPGAPQFLYRAVSEVPPVAATHLHGGFTEARCDGWTENLLQHGESTTHAYGNDQAAALLWYHDHAMHVTRLTVYAGLAGLYQIRDDEDRAVVNALRLHPGGYGPGTAVRPAYELPLLIQDVNLEVDGNGALTGQLVHKVDAGTMEFFGPYTMVNRQIWPKVTVKRRQYRLRLLNGSNARTFRLSLLADAGTATQKRVGWSGFAQVIGTDGGLRAHPIAADDDLVLMPAERLDVVVDFGADALRGVQRLTVLNSAAAPFGGSALGDPVTEAESMPGSANWADRVRYPAVLRFDLTGPRRPKALPLPSPLTASFRRLALPGAPAVPGYTTITVPQTALDAARRVALVEENLTSSAAEATLTLRELQPPAHGHASHRTGHYHVDGMGTVSYTGDRLISITEPGGTAVEYATVAKLFSDASTFTARIGDVEVWKVLNLTSDSHPFHVHLVQLQVLARYRAAADLNPGAENWPVAPSATPVAPASIPAPLVSVHRATAADLAWKDVIRVDPGELVLIAVPFGSIDPVSNTVRPKCFAGRYMYHCHLLEHEDHDMMRPFAVLPDLLADLSAAHGH